MRVGPNEPVLFRAVGEVLLDDPRGLILPLRSVRGWPDAVALVIDRRRVRLVRLAGRSPAGHAGPRSFEFRKHGPRPSPGSTEITMPACAACRLVKEINSCTEAGVSTEATKAGRGAFSP